MTPRPPETLSPAFARGEELAAEVRDSTIADLAAVVAAGDTSRDAERNLRLWMLDRLRQSAAVGASLPPGAPEPPSPRTPEPPTAPAATQAGYPTRSVGDER